MSTDTSVSQKISLEFKSTALTVPVIVLATNNLKHIEHQLEEKIAQAPDFFKHSPILIDLQVLNKNNLAIDLGEVVRLLKKHYFFPVGIRGGNDEQKISAIDLQLPSHAAPMVRAEESSSRIAVNPEPTDNPPTEEDDPRPAVVANKLMTQPVRSGQRVYARGDLIITATVSAGAEIMAEGNIHVYGALRGRALAGVQGNTECRIFCSDLEAELIAIAGTYKVSDELDDAVRHKPVQISLDKQAIIITPI